MNEVNISEDRKKYLKKIKRNKIAIFCTRLIIVVVFIVGWELLADAGIIDSLITSKPSEIAKTFMNLSSNDLL